jgi:ATP synthase protein I
LKPDKDEEKNQSENYRKFGVAMGAGWVVVSSIVICALVGYGLDTLFHTKRIFLVIMFILGIAAGLYNLVRELRRLE